MSELSEQVERTLGNLEKKAEFLEEQRGHFIALRQRLVEYDPEKYAAHAGDGGSGVRGLVFGEVILSTRVYLSLGCEYYVEKQPAEAVAWVEGRLRLLEDAQDQFRVQIAHAKSTLRELAALDGAGGADWAAESSGEDGLPLMEIREELDEDGNVTSGAVRRAGGPEAGAKRADAAEEGLPLMEIREELDEDGNVTGGSVRRAGGNVQRAGRAASASDAGHKSQDTGAARPDQAAEERPEQDLAPQQPAEDAGGLDEFYEVLEEMGITAPRESVDVGTPVEAAESGSVSRVNAIDHDDIYSFDELVRQLEQTDLDSDDDFDPSESRYDYESAKLALGWDNEDNGNSEYEDEDEDEDDNDYDGTYMPSVVPGGAAQASFFAQVNKLRAEKLSKMEKAPVTPRPILKNRRPTTSTKKSVGFAPKLDIYEVENVKKETKANTFSFPRNRYLLDQQDTRSSTLDDDGFDSELFARLIGAKPADEIHGRFQTNWDQSAIKSKPKISLFKQNRGSLLCDVLEREPAINDIVEREPAINDIVEREPAINDIVEREPAINDIVEREPAINDIVEREPAVSDIVERKSSKLLTKKDLKSLRKPREASRIVETINFSDSEEEIQDSSVQADINESAENSSDKHHHRAPVQDQSFPAVIQKHIDARDDVIQDIKVDYQLLGRDLDDMAKAYALGAYDDDVDDPGALLEKLEDLKVYNALVEELKDDISDFRDGSTSAADKEDSDEPVISDVIEHDLNDAMLPNSDDIDVQYDRLIDEVSLQYHSMRKRMVASSAIVSNVTEESLELEPIDEFGNPITTSRFKTALTKPVLPIP
ncbi:FAFR519Cp [Eremothecium gossypii FDAG1]|nr:FAFR519Cp [Eremothecium gossypii FDAG1]